MSKTIIQPKNKKQATNDELIKLINLSINGLNDLYIPQKEEFAFRKKKLNGSYIIEGTNTRYTLINLLGLYKAKCNSFDIKLDLNPILEKQIKNVTNYKSGGNIGLLLWATAFIAPHKIGNIASKINFRNIAKDYKDIQLGLTTELSWLLIGLLTASTFNSNLGIIANQLIEYVYIKLRENYHGRGIFGHQSTDTLSGKLRGELGSFSDQVYPIYAFVMYSKLRNSEEALNIADACAKKICKYQDNYGAWAWHYNSITGKVISKYPVYSVHQDAMAPIALYSVQRATGKNYEKNIFKGLSWLNNNMYNVNMIDFENILIKRAVGPKNVTRKVKSFLAHLGIKDKLDFSRKSIVDECWSYHLGWLLFAFSGRVNNFSNNVDKNVLFHDFSQINNN